MVFSGDRDHRICENDTPTDSTENTALGRASSPTYQRKTRFGTSPAKAGFFVRAQNRNFNLRVDIRVAQTRVAQTRVAKLVAQLAKSFGHRTAFIQRWCA
ncbi:hypothetical protein K227x_49870 [Rubripirellula lacrimiformis]|uniref:Uncharacterized protein n=1 Tax=Rubripirellula lacrimiformis TaxID=1930273 RepID=A0A517NHG2_9BACT|nr:hypothetical protein K227x_49870 [Rubripirellula lacrimiformis]